ncbi:MAG: hypothetical protein J6J61_08340 [Muribaculaceae bacterium]|nr:hypothetical protein [Muribaculaceae bacterium]
MGQKTTLSGEKVFVYHVLPSLHKESLYQIAEDGSLIPLEIGDSGYLPVGRLFSELVRIDYGAWISALLETSCYETRLMPGKDESYAGTVFLTPESLIQCPLPLSEDAAIALAHLALGDFAHPVRWSHAAGGNQGAAEPVEFVDKSESYLERWGDGGVEDIVRWKKRFDSYARTPPEIGRSKAFCSILKSEGLVPPAFRGVASCDSKLLVTPCSLALYALEEGILLLIEENPQDCKKASPPIIKDEIEQLRSISLKLMGVISSDCRSAVDIGCEFADGLERLLEGRIPQVKGGKGKPSHLFPLLKKVLALHGTSRDLIAGNDCLLRRLEEAEDGFNVTVYDNIEGGEDLMFTTSVNEMRSLQADGLFGPRFFASMFARRFPISRGSFLSWSREDEAFGDEVETICTALAHRAECESRLIEIRSLGDLLGALFFGVCLSDAPIEKCPRCGHFFVREHSKGAAKYCSVHDTQTGRTCQETSRLERKRGDKPHYNNTKSQIDRKLHGAIKEAKKSEDLDAFKRAEYFGSLSQFVKVIGRAYYRNDDIEADLYRKWLKAVSCATNSTPPERLPYYVIVRRGSGWDLVNSKPDFDSQLKESMQVSPKAGNAL